MYRSQGELYCIVQRGVRQQLIQQTEHIEELYQRCTNAAKEYLVMKGVDASRMRW